MNVWVRHVHPGLNAPTWRAGTGAFVLVASMATLMELVALKSMNVQERHAAGTPFVEMKRAHFLVHVQRVLEGTLCMNVLVSTY